MRNQIEPIIITDAIYTIQYTDARLISDVFWQHENWKKYINIKQLVYVSVQTLEGHPCQEQVDGLFLMTSWITSNGYMFIWSILLQIIL